ncbi:MAG: MBL fold metallo-hydrolase [Halobacteriota archaeon]
MLIQEGFYGYKEKGLLDANTYVIKSDTTTVLVDPGREKYLGLLLEELRGDGIDPENIDSILITHLHPDHYDATAVLKEITGAKVALHSSQLVYRDVMTVEASRFLGMGMGVSKRFEVDISFDDRYLMGTKELAILHTPGHSPESICLYDASEKALICGDLVFDKGVGRTDLPFGDLGELIESINRVAALDTALLLPGHGAMIKGSNRVKRNYEFITGFVSTQNVV